MELLAQGWSLSAACREVGVVWTTGHNWMNGSKVRLKDGTVKHVPPVDPLSVRALSPRFLSEQERVQIADLAGQGHGPTIAVDCCALFPGLRWAPRAFLLRRPLSPGVENRWSRG